MEPRSLSKMKKGPDAGKAGSPGSKDDANDIQEKMKKVGVKSSPPAAGAARVKQLQESSKAVGQPRSSSGSATGEPT